MLRLLIGPSEDVIYMRDYMKFVEGITENNVDNKPLSNIPDLSKKTTTRHNVYESRYLLYTDDYCATKPIYEVYISGRRDIKDTF